jgi:mannose-6-phosphate isomerase-like protein (cupin superfamily)
MPQIEPFTPQITEKPWGEEVLIAHMPKGWQDREGKHFGGYAGKILKRYADDEHHRAGLQYHAFRDETFHLISGEVIVYFVDDGGVLRKHEMHPGESFHIPPGAIHSVQTITDSVMFEASCGPVTSGDAVNVEAAYDISKAIDG